MTQCTPLYNLFLFYLPIIIIVVVVVVAVVVDDDDAQWNGMYQGHQYAYFSIPNSLQQIL